jgi:hypothetical protein
MSRGIAFKILDCMLEAQFFPEEYKNLWDTICRKLDYPDEPNLRRIWKAQHEAVMEYCSILINNSAEDDYVIKSGD